MKDNFLNLIHQVESIEAKFHNTSSAVFSMPSLELFTMSLIFSDGFKASK